MTRQLFIYSHPVSFQKALRVDEKDTKNLLRHHTLEIRDKENRRNHRRGLRMEL